MSEYLLLLGFVGLTAGLAMLVTGMVQKANHSNPASSKESSRDDIKPALEAVDPSTATWVSEARAEPRSAADAIKTTAIETAPPNSIAYETPKGGSESTTRASESTQQTSAMAMPEPEEGVAAFEAYARPVRQLEVKTFGRGEQTTVAAAMPTSDEGQSPSKEDVPVASSETFPAKETEQMPAATVSTTRTPRQPLERKLTEYARRWLRDFLEYRPDERPGK